MDKNITLTGVVKYLGIIIVLNLMVPGVIFSMDDASAAPLLTPDTLYAVSESDLLLRTITPATGAPISSVPIVPDTSCTGVTLTGGSGLATDSTGTIFGIMVTALDGPFGPRELVIITPGTTSATATCLGSTGVDLGDITFDSFDVLYGTGNFFTHPIFTISTGPVVSTFACDLVGFTFGTSLAFNSGDGFLYALVDDDPPFMKKITLPLSTGGLCTSSSIFLTSFDAEEPEALAYSASDGEFIFGSSFGSTNLSTITPTGLYTSLLSIHTPFLDGLTFVPPPPPPTSTTLEQLIDDVQALIDSDDLKEKDGEKLIKELNKAADKLDDDKTDKACDKLDKFIKKVDKLVDKDKLSEADGDVLIQSAQNIKDDLGCVDDEEDDDDEEDEDDDDEEDEDDDDEEDDD